MYSGGKSKSFRQMLNSRGPNTDPWGTPCINSTHELNFLFMCVAIYLKGNLAVIWGHSFQNHKREVSKWGAHGL